MKIELEGYGEVEMLATMYTLLVYEQEFGSDPIKDVFGKHQVEQGGETVLTIDYTQENWFEETRLLWAMVKTANDLADERGDVAPNDRTPPYRKWVKKVGKVNMRDIANAVIGEAVDGFFHTGAAASE